MDLTILTCNYNTPDLVVKMLKSLKVVSKELPKVVVMNTSKSHAENEMDDNEIPYYNFRHGIHGEAVNLGFKKVNTRYVLLVDSDIIFLQDFQKPFERFKRDGLTLMGNVVGNVAGKQLHPRVEPWYCFIDLEFLKRHRIQFFDGERTRKSKESLGTVYDIGSTMFEDVSKFSGLIGNVNLEGKYFKHYGGMSWRSQKYDPYQEDTDIDFGGTHPHRVLYDIGLRVRAEYESETKHLKDVDIKGLYQYG